MGAKTGASANAVIAARLNCLLERSRVIRENGANVLCSEVKSQSLNLKVLHSFNLQGNHLFEYSPAQRLRARTYPSSR